VHEMNTMWCCMNGNTVLPPFLCRVLKGIGGGGFVLLAVTCAVNVLFAWENNRR